MGGIVGALVGLGLPEYEAKRYEGRVKDGGGLLSVHCESSEAVDRAKEVLKQTGAGDISSAGEKRVSSHHVDDVDDQNRRVEKRSQLIENRLEPGSFFVKLRRPKGVGDRVHGVDRSELREEEIEDEEIDARRRTYYGLQLSPALLN